ncbi:AAA family ATPase [Emcibacter sp. SYSU 3D8]|uniref:AAA family ATPase n=1 Tax=Emcibacter sp. SYSU 3D8 TaxID=3133969 RepID=UPI0031FE5D37
MDARPVAVVADYPAVDPDRDQIAIFLDVVFGYCDGWIPLRALAEQGHTSTPVPRMTWVQTSGDVTEGAFAFARQAARDGAAFYVVPGTVKKEGAAKAADIQQMQAVLTDLDHGDIPAKLAHLVRYLGRPTMIVESGGITPEGHDKLHVWWRLSEAVQDEDLQRVCRLREQIASKVGGDRHFASAHQPIRVAGSIYHKHGVSKLVRIRDHSRLEVDLDEFAARVEEMPALEVAAGDEAARLKPSVKEVLTTPVREGGEDAWTRFEGASAAIGHYVRQSHEGRMSRDDAWEAVCGYNAAMLRPSWSADRLGQEFARLWRKHVERNGLPLPPRPRTDTPDRALPVFRLAALLDDTSPMPGDIISPRVLTPGGLLVLGGAPKVGKSDLLISWLVHMAAGAPFLGFTPARPLRVFYLQAEIQYHYLRERLKQIALPPEVLRGAGDNFVATPKLKMLLDSDGVTRTARAVQAAFPEVPPDVICLDPIRNLFDGGPDGGGENDNTAMMFFLKERVESLRDQIDPDCGVILVHHTRKLGKQHIKDDPFLALSGASALRGFYTSGLILHRPDETCSQRRLEIELRNGPALPAKLIDKVAGQWVELNPINERLVRQEVGARHDAERDRKRDVILSILLEEAAEGRLYTSTQFREAFENQRGLGSQSTIRDRISVLATKGHIRFLRDGTEFGHSIVRSRFGYLCAEGMVFGREGRIDPETGEVLNSVIPVVPSHYKSASNGQCLDLADPSDWSVREAEDA